jgi:uncharacterized protein YqjF (DUF2071 family)
VSTSGFLEAATRQARLATDASHRPWPLPEAPWTQAETRERAVLAHWPVPVSDLARLVPPELELQTFAGEAWLGVGCFPVTNLRLRGLPPLPGLSSLLELEVRTYVSDGDRPGIWLLSLEVTHRLMVEAAKRRHRLPAYRAEISLVEDGDALAVWAERDGLRFTARCRPSGSAAAAAPGSFEEFACERFALYTADGGRLYRAELHHAPSRLRPARLELEEATLVPVVLEGDARALTVERHDLLVWPLVEL